MNAAQHKIINLLKTLFVSVCVFNVWPKTTLLPVWPEMPKGWTPLGSVLNVLLKCLDLKRSIMGNRQRLLSMGKNE